jgi:hypothetical protein
MSPRGRQHRKAALRTSDPYSASRPPLRALLPYLSASRSPVLLSVSLFGPSSLAQLLWPRLTSDDASEDLSIFVAQQHAARSPRVLRTDLHAYARRIYFTAFRTRIGLCIFTPAHPAVLPLSASCSSRQRFASGFLQTLSRPKNPCLPLTLPRVGRVADFHLQVGAPCRAHQRKRGPLVRPPLRSRQDDDRVTRARS